MLELIFTNNDNDNDDDNDNDNGFNGKISTL